MLCLSRRRVEGYSDTVATLTGSSTVDANRNTFKISNMGTASDFSPFAEGSSLNFGAINYWGDVIIRADSIRFPLQYNSTASDTSLVKPLVISPSGKIGRLISWSLIGGGGGSQNLQQVTDIGNTTTKSIQVGDSLRVQGGNDPFVAMKQATSNQEYRLRVGVGTGVSSQSFSLYDATAGASRMVITTAGHMVLGRESLPADHSRLLVYGGLNGANIDALPDSTQNDESNMEVMGADYYGSSFQGYGVAMTYNGNANTGSIMNYSKKNFGQLRFTGVTNFLRVISNASLRFATNNTEWMALDSLGNLGIGVKVPSYKLHVEAAAGSTTTPFYVNDSEDNTGYVAQFGKSGVLKAAIGTDGNIYMVDMSAPSTPSSGYGTIYVRSDSLRFKNDGGTEFTLGVSSGGGGTPAGSNKQVQYNSSGSFAGAAGVEIGNTNNRLYLQGQATTEVPLIIQAVSSQSADLIQFKNSSGTVKASMISDGSRFGFGQAAAAVDGVVQILTQGGLTKPITWSDGASTGGELKATGSLSSIGTNNTTPFALVYNTSEKFRVDASGSQINSRFRQAQGGDVASANNLSLGTDGNAFEITGTTTINLISNTNWQNGSVIRLVFSSSLTVTNNAGTSGSNINILLAGGANFSATANDILTLMLCEIGSVQNWVEVSRSVN
jgi:hypothetical protein